MTTSTKSATALLQEMNDLQVYLHLTTCECGKRLRTYTQFGRIEGECKNPVCRRLDVTMDVATLATLSNADLDAKGYPDYSVQTAKVG